LKNRAIFLATLFGVVSFLVGAQASDADLERVHRSASGFFIPSTISEEAKDYLRTFSRATRDGFNFPGPAGLEAIHAHRERQAAMPVSSTNPVLTEFSPIVTRRVLGGVPVIEITPASWESTAKILIYLHGGCYVFGTAEDSLNGSVPIASAAGLKTISVDYTTAPQAKWPEVTNEIVRVVQSLVTKGRSMEDLAIIGDSAGGGLAAAVALKLRNKGIGMPAALVLWSPWTDLTETGDTYITLKNNDPWYVFERFSEHCANAYADQSDRKNPYVSPVYGKFGRGFPPTLIQVGTKETFLSNSVRLYQAIDQAGGDVWLDVYEGMPHIFQVQYSLPESRVAISKAANFLRRKLNLPQ
jgi:monoterpene epsilon-lactone hydrolase